MKIAEKQPRVFQQLQASVTQAKLVHAYLFEGELGTGKQEMANWLSQAVFCLATEPVPCGTCLNCQRIAQGEHPDVLTIIPDGQTIKVDQIREIKATFTKSGIESKQKILLLQDAEKMTVSAANSLLKFIEEPDGQILVILLTTARAQILPTIQSRCQIIHFTALSETVLQKELENMGYQSGNAKLASQLTNSREKAIEILEDEWFNEAKATVFKWVSEIVTDNAFAFVYVQQKIIKVFKEKEQQGMFFELVLFYLRELLAQKIKGEELQPVTTRWSRKKLLSGIEQVLLSRKKLSANVSFQNVCEQLALNLSNG